MADQWPGANQAQVSLSFCWNPKAHENRFMSNHKPSLSKHIPSIRENAPANCVLETLDGQVCAIVRL